MRTESGISVGSANSHGGRIAVEIQRRKDNGTSAVDDESWFSRAAQRLYTSKPGTALHHLTGLGDERLCQRYAADHVRPGAYFLRRLLRSKHGEQWLNATMDGCAEPWWLELQHAKKISAALSAVKR